MVSNCYFIINILLTQSDFAINFFLFLVARGLIIIQHDNFGLAVILTLIIIGKKKNCKYLKKQNYLNQYQVPNYIYFCNFRVNTSYTDAVESDYSDVDTSYEPLQNRTDYRRTALTTLKNMISDNAVCFSTNKLLKTIGKKKKN